MKIGAVRTVDIATAGRPVEALAEAALGFSDDVGVLQLAVHHDAGCPCLNGKAMPSCTCEVVHLEGRRVA
jgi:hypothetical protein